VRRLIESTVLTAHSRKSEYLLSLQLDQANIPIENVEPTTDSQNKNVDGWDVVVRSIVMTFNTASQNGANSNSLEMASKDPVLPSPLLASHVSSVAVTSNA
jgi:hypothetical protein